MKKPTASRHPGNISTRILCSLFLLLGALVPLQAQIDLNNFRAPYWEGLTPEGKTISILGTMHLGKPEFYPLAAPAQQRLDQCKTLWLEVSEDEMDLGTSSKLLMTYAMLPPGQKIQDYFPKDLTQKLSDHLKTQGISLVQLQGLAPWFIYMTVTGLDFENQGLQTEWGTEKYLMGLLKPKKVPIKGLETLEFQFQTFAGWDFQEIQRALEEFLQDPIQSQTVTLDELLKLKTNYPNLYTRLNSQRNQTMAQRIHQEVLRSENPVFAVGAMHLMGPDGIPALLEKKGVRWIHKGITK